jgi:hypothetical protein
MNLIAMGKTCKVSAFLLFIIVQMGCSEPATEKRVAPVASVKNTAKSCCNAGLPSRFGAKVTKTDMVLLEDKNGK